MSAWWYQLDGTPAGPISEADLRKLVEQGQIGIGTPTWHESFGEHWKPFFLVFPGTTVGRPKWQKVFKEFDEASGFHVKPSVWGFLFGPIYYLYLRMWRKGFVALALAMSLSVALSFLQALSDVPLQKLTAPIVSASCGLLAYRDYWKLKRFDERMWPNLRWFEPIWAIVCLSLAPIVAAVVIVVIANTSEPSNSAQSAPASRTVMADRSKPPVPHGAQSEFEASWDPKDRKKVDPESVATRNCTRWLERVYAGDSQNAYDPETKYHYEIAFQGGNLMRIRVYFGNHQTMSFNAQLKKSINGELMESIDMPQHVCVLDDNLNVIGMENDMNAGLP